MHTTGYLCTVASRVVVSVIVFLCLSCGLMPSEVDYRKADKLGTKEA